MNDDSTFATDHVQLTNLLNRYAATLDDTDAAAWIDCWVPGTFTPDVVEEVMRFHRQYERTFHVVLNCRHAIEGDRATGTTDCLVTYVKRTGEDLTKFDTYSRYEDEEFVRQEGRWRILKRRWTPIFSTQEVPLRPGVPPDFWDGYEWMAGNPDPADGAGAER